MHIASIEIDGSFKAFSGLTITELPPARVVVLVGANGSGKSSVFDAMLFWAHQRGRPQTGTTNNDYYAHPDGSMAQRIDLTFHEPDDGSAARKIHVRSAYRFTPIIRTSGVASQPTLAEQPVISRMIDQDTTAVRHYQVLIGRFVRLLSDLTQETKLADVRKELEPLVKAVHTVFPDLELESLGDALQDGSFFFNKKNNKNFRYENLSSGEKAAFDLLLDLYVSGREFADGVICVDEPETHLNPRVQANLLDAIDELVPVTCQVWIATHSVGLLRRALEMYQEDNQKVVFLSFVDVVAGTPTDITPTIVDRIFWRRALDVALDDLAALVAPETVYLCEGSTDASKEVTYAWDAQIYRTIFHNSYPQIDFVSVGGQAELKIAGEIATVVAPGSTRLRLRDRDSLTNSARQKQLDEDPNLRILERRTLESYLVDDEIIAKLVTKYGIRPDKNVADMTGARESAITAAKQDDNAKTAVGAVYATAKAVLRENGQLGENSSQFSRDVLAPLVTPDTAVYAELKKILGL